jgi:hypothetical protein
VVPEKIIFLHPLHWKKNVNKYPFSAHMRNQVFDFLCPYVVFNYKIIQRDVK